MIKDKIADLTDVFRDDNVDVYRYDITKQCEEIKKLLNRGSGPDNILLVGMAGAGKSSLVNTLSQALTMSWSPQARVGRKRRAGTPITDTFTWYKMCNVTSKDSCRISDWRQLPNIVDMAGYAGQNLEHWKRILLGAVQGKIPEETSIKDLMDVVDKSPHHFDVCYPNDTRKISKIVFVARINEDINVELLKTVLEVARQENGEGQELPVYAVLSNYDRVGKDDETGVTLEEATKNVNTLVEHLEIEGSQKDYLTIFCNYSDSVKPINLNVEKETLNFLRMMLVHRPKPFRRPLSPYTLEQKMRLLWIGRPREVIIGAIVFCVFMFIFSLFNRKIIKDEL